MDKNEARRLRYKTDATYREACQESSRKNNKIYRDKKIMADKEWNAKKQKNYRTNHPDVFNRCMAKCYLRRMDVNSIRELYEEIMNEKTPRRTFFGISI